MKKLLLTLVVAGMCFGMVGCATKSSLEGLSPTLKVAQTAKFESGEVTDKSGFVFGEKDDKIVLTDAMKSSLTAALATEDLAGNDYVIKTTILQYSPGNAFARWMLPGAGATKLVTESEIYTPEGVLVAKIPVNRSIAAGGGYTIGAWKTVFDDVAQEIVKVLKEQLLGIKKAKVNVTE